MLNYVESKTAKKRAYTYKFSEQELTELKELYFSHVEEYDEEAQKIKEEIKEVKQELKDKFSQMNLLKKKILQKHEEREEELKTRLYTSEKRVDYISLNGKVVYTRQALPDELINLFGEPEVKDPNASMKVVKLNKEKVQA